MDQQKRATQQIMYTFLYRQTDKEMQELHIIQRTPTTSGKKADITKAATPRGNSGTAAGTSSSPPSRACGRCACTA